MVEDLEKRHPRTIHVEHSQHVDHAAIQADRTPTPDQKEAGNYRKGHIRIHGLDVAIENAAGSERSGKGWKVTMPYHYGYVKGTKGADGDQVDVCIGPDISSPRAFIIDQVFADTGKFDEHKVMLGYFHRGDAINAYDAAFSDGKGPLRRGAVHAMHIDAFKAWLDSGKTDMPLCNEIYKGLELADDLLKWGDDQINHPRGKGGAWTSGPAVLTNLAHSKPRLAFDRKRYKRYFHWQQQDFLLGKAWEESEHPRDKMGRFAELATEGAAAAVTVAAAFLLRRQLSMRRYFGWETAMAPNKFKEGVTFGKHPTTVNEALKHANKILDREKAVISHKGRLLNADLGDENSASLGISRNKWGAKVHHNHPGAVFSPPSGADLRATGSNPFSKHYVVGASGTVYKYHVVGSALSGSDVAVIHDVIMDRILTGTNIADKFSNYVKANRDWLKVKLHPESKKEIDVEFGSVVNHGILLGLRDAGMIKYQYRLSKKDRALVEAFEPFVKNVRKYTAENALKAKSAIGVKGRYRRAKEVSIGALDNLAFIGKREGGGLLVKADDPGIYRIASTLVLRKFSATDPLSIASAVEDALATGAAKVMNWLGGKPADSVAAAATGGPDAAAQALPQDAMQERLGNALSPMDTAYRRSAMVSAANSNPGRTIDFTFDHRNKRVQDFLENYKFDLIKQITDNQADTIKQIVTGAMMEGLPPATMAQRIREVIGLTASQAQHVVNYREELENLDKPGMAQSVFGRALRDRRFDRSVQNAITSGDALSDDQITAMVDAYRKRYIAYRAMTIARTESLRAANMGAQAVADEMAMAGYDVVKRWIATKDNRTRDTHRALNGQEVTGSDTAFVTTAGNEIKYPHDPDAPPSETINCRCTMAVRYVPKDEGGDDETSDDAVQ